MKPPLLRALTAWRTVGKRRSGAARAAGLVAGLGVSFGFIGVVFAIVYESFMSLPDGVRPNDYATVGRREAESGLFAPLTSMDFDAIRQAAPEAEWSYASISVGDGQVADASGNPRRVRIRRASGNFLGLLGVRPALGAIALIGDGEAAVLSAKTWRNEFASDPDVVGEAVTVDDDTLVPIIGVADPTFTGLFPQRTDIWLLEAESMDTGQDEFYVRGGLYLFGVLGQGTTIIALQSLLAGHEFFLEEQRNDRVEAVRGLELQPDARRETRQRLAWLAMVVALLLALAITGFVDFLAADHAVREDELAVRLAVGATPGDVFLGSVARHARYAVWIGAAALATFLYVGDALVGMEPFASALGELGFASSAFGFGTGVVLLAAAFLWSCAVAGRAAVRRSLTGARASRRSRPAWAALLFMAAASLLLCLSIASRYVADSASTLGFAHRDALMVGAIYNSGPTPASARRIRDALATDASVTAAAWAEMLPLLDETIGPDNRVMAAGYPALADTVFYRNRVDAPFFEVLDAKLLTGALLDDDRTREAVLSRTAAMLFHPEEIDAAIGLTVELAPEHAPDHGDVFTVVGVVEDIPYGAPEEPSRPVIYTKLADADASSRYQDFWLIRHAGDDADVVALMQRAGGGIDEAYRIATPAELLDERVAERSVDAVLAMAGAFAFALALGGVANALSRTVANQAKQVGIRYALGATEADETRRIAAAALVDLLVAGALLCGAVVAGRLLAPALLEVVTLPLVAVVLAVVAGVCVLGSYLSVRRFARFEAITALAGR